MLTALCDLLRNYIENTKHSTEGLGLILLVPRDHHIW